MSLDSDVENADSKLSVEFYTNVTPLHNGKAFVRIMVPGDKTTIIDQPVREDHKARFPRQWLYFQMKNAGDAIPGTKLQTWHDDEPETFTIGQMEELQMLKFQVVEQVAGASDSQLQRVGMGGIGLRERAKAYLAFKNRDAASVENQTMKNEIAELRAMVASLTSVNPEKRGPGRPRKEEAA